MIFVFWTIMRKKYFLIKFVFIILNDKETLFFTQYKFLNSLFEGKNNKFLRKLNQKRLKSSNFWPWKLNRFKFLTFWQLNKKQNFLFCFSNIKNLSIKINLIKLISKFLNLLVQNNKGLKNDVSIVFQIYFYY